ncbi:MAG TPA: hypothetical protein PKY59_19030 [Pyrinomonadaceae bacterium]|nr:hypothetical protein [Pyrinomonadaceae bacterium]
MSNKNNNEENNKTDKSRRRFIRNAALGAAGITLGLTLTRAERALAKFASRHAEDFFSKASRVSPERGDGSAFDSIYDQVKEMLDTNDQFKANADRIFANVLNNSSRFAYTKPKTILDLHTDTTNLLATAYLGGLASLRERAPDREQIAAILSDPSRIDRLIESGFVNNLYRQSNSEIETNDVFRENVSSAVSQLEGLARREREPCYVPVYQDGVLVGFTPCWVVVVVVVVIILVAILK